MQKGSLAIKKKKLNMLCAKQHRQKVHTFDVSCVVKLETFSCDDSSSLLSLRICCE